MTNGKDDFLAAVESLKELIDTLPEDEKNIRVTNIRSALATYTNWDEPEVKASREKEALRVRNVRIARLEADIKQFEAEIKQLRLVKAYSISR